MVVVVVVVVVGRRVRGVLFDGFHNLVARCASSLNRCVRGSGSCGTIAGAKALRRDQRRRAAVGGVGYGGCEEGAGRRGFALVVGAAVDEVDGLPGDVAVSYTHLTLPTICSV